MLFVNIRLIVIDSIVKHRVCLLCSLVLFRLVYMSKSLNNVNCIH
uniref:Uncharacterized protein n=1 Tax=Rhizophora mucronata TaxID=61149 RepID=A0A2P2P5U9_RHIMU